MTPAEAKRRWRENNPEHARKYRKENREHRNALKRKWRANYPEKVHRSNRFYTVRRFGITTEEYDAMLASQNGACKICGNPPGKKSLAIDHDHATGKVRGLLCGRCNRALGQFKDNPELCRKGADYLEAFL